MVGAVAKAPQDSSHLEDVELDDPAPKKESPASAPARDRRNPKAILMLCLLIPAWIIWQMDKVNLSIAIMPMMDQFHWPDGIVGTVNSSFFYGYLVMQIPGGMLTQAIGGKRTLALGFTLFATGTLLTPSAAALGLGPLLVVRALVGLGEGMAPPAETALVSQWFPSHDRARAFGVVGLAQNSGAVIGQLAASLILSLSWHAIFYFFGSISMVWLAFWLMLGEDAPKPQKYQTLQKETKDAVQAASQEEGEVVESEDGNEQPRRSFWRELLCLPWVAFFRSRSIWAIIMIHFAYNWGFYTLLSWLPIFFREGLGFQKQHAAFLSMIPSVSIAIACPVSGFVADSLILRGWSVTLVRRVMQTCACVGASCSLSLLLLLSWESGGINHDHAGLYIAIISLSCACMAGSFGGFYGSWADISPKYAGVLNGLSSTGGALAGLVGNQMAGTLLQQTGKSWGKSLFLPIIIWWLVGAAGWNVLFVAKEVDFDE